MNGTFHIAVAMKPLHGNFSKNAVIHGVAGLNIEGCRIGAETIPRHVRGKPDPRWETAVEGGVTEEHQGRWPANVLHDGHEDIVAAFPKTGPAKASMRGAGGGGDKVQQLNERVDSLRGHNDAGGTAARYFKQVDEFVEQE